MATEPRSPEPIRKSSGRAGAGAHEPPVGDDAVRAKTGRRWAEWFALMDRDGCADMTHKEIAMHLATEHDVAPWWAQMVTVGYERARGLREKHQTAQGFAASASRTVHVPLDRLYAAWADRRQLRRWLPEVPFTVRKATENRSIRMAWGDGTFVDAMFYSKGDGKSYVSVDQRKLANAAAVSRAKSFWKERLTALKDLLED